MYSTPWLVRKSGKRNRMRLFCFTYAGGSAVSYMPWQAAFEPDVEVCGVQLPGRGVRFGEMPYTSMEALIADLAGVLSSYNELPFVFFGHSLGALVAFELARHCKHHHLAMPEQLIVSGCEAPQMRSELRSLSELDDDALIKELQVFNGTPPEVLTNRELMSLVLPVIRADFALAEKYVYRSGLPLDIPITALAGKLDKETSLEKVEGWRLETTSECHVRWFAGDHFFINDERDSVLNYLAALLSEVQYM